MCPQRGQLISWGNQALFPSPTWVWTFSFPFFSPTLLNFDSTPIAQRWPQRLSPWASCPSPGLGKVNPPQLSAAVLSYVGLLLSSEFLLTALGSIGHPHFFLLLPVGTLVIMKVLALIVSSHLHLYLGFMGLPCHPVLLET